MTDSNLGRALIDWFLVEAGDRLVEAAKDGSGVLQRPASADLIGMADFDAALRHMVARALTEGGRAVPTQKVSGRFSAD
ncbi:MAG: hypothetical protein GY937_06915 [bacterium]|nr:hypothetical protein [bacterium]